MPFGIKLKKTRRYNVSNKNSFVARVKLLDGMTIWEFTLNPENTGQDLLDMVCQKLEILETEFFGLQYTNKIYKLRWIDNDKALKKQLEKCAQDTHTHTHTILNLGIMLFTPNINNLHQEVTRYMYFLQLKNSIIEGTLPCTPQQAVSLASFAVQAEFGDHAGDLQDYVLLPKNLTNDMELLNELTHEIILLHASHKGMATETAEFAYISEASQLEGYGQESYPAKDESGSDLLLGASFLGIFVKHLNGKPTIHFKWNDIDNLVHNKRFFGIKRLKSEDTVQFQMEDPETAKYVWRMCVLKHKFYRLSMAQVKGLQEVSLDRGRNISTEAKSMTAIQRKPSLIRKSSDQQENVLKDITHRQDKIFLQDDDYQDSLDRPGSHLNIHRVSVDHGYANGGGNALDHSGSVYSSPSINSLNQQPFAMHIGNAQVSPVSSNPSLASNEVRMAIPQYRPSPDYEALIQYKVSSVSESHSMANLGSAHAYSHPETMAYSQPEIRQRNMVAPTQPGMHYGQTVNLSQSQPAYTAYMESSESLPYDHRMTSNLPHTYSTPELTTQQMHDLEYINAKLLMDKYKPPPPYLAHQSLQKRQVSSSSPDLLRNMHTREEDVVLRTLEESSLSSLNNPQTVPIHSLQAMSLSDSHIDSTGTAILPNIPRDSSQDGTMEMSMFDKTIPPPVMYDDFNEAKDSLAGTRDLTVSPVSTEPNTYRVVSQTQIHDIIEPPQEFAQDSSDTRPELLENIDVAEVCLVNKENHKISELKADTIQEARDVRDDIQKKTYIQSISNVSLEPETLEIEQKNKKEAHSNRDNFDCSQSEHLAGSESDSMGNEDRMEWIISGGGYMGPLKLAAMNGLTLGQVTTPKEEEKDNLLNFRDARRKLLERKLEEGLLTEYESVIKKRPNAFYTTSLKPENIHKNRFSDVLPYEANRVQIRPSQNNTNGYINASYISVTLRGEELHYIAAQSPLENNVSDWWRMVWEQDVHVIVMLTAVEEGGKEKCYKYWPLCGTKNNTQTYGQFQVTGKFSNDSGFYVTNSFILMNKMTGEERSVWHLQYTDWPEKGNPDDIQGFLVFLEEVQSVCRMAHGSLDVMELPPVLVHCSAGVGRTGVTILCDIMIDCLEHNEDIQLVDMLLLLRQQRMLMVQTVGQYIFVYKTLIHFLKNSRLI